MRAGGRHPSQTVVINWEIKCKPPQKHYPGASSVETAKLIKGLDLLRVQDGFRGCLEIRNEKVTTARGRPLRWASAEPEAGLHASPRSCRRQQCETLPNIHEKQARPSAAPRCHPAG